MLVGQSVLLHRLLPLVEDNWVVVESGIPSWKLRPILSVWETILASMVASLFNWITTKHPNVKHTRLMILNAAAKDDRQQGNQEQASSP